MDDEIDYLIAHYTFPRMYVPGEHQAACSSFAVTEYALSPESVRMIVDKAVAYALKKEREK